MHFLWIEIDLGLVGWIPAVINEQLRLPLFQDRAGASDGSCATKKCELRWLSPRARD